MGLRFKVRNNVETALEQASVAKPEESLHLVASGVEPEDVAELPGLPPEDGSVFDMLNSIIQHEPTSLFNPEMLGRLATLGIEKGKPFQPDARMQRIFDLAANQGVAMCRAIGWCLA